MDDWQDAAFSSRHMHNRGTGNSKSSRKAFDVRKTFGSYSLKCVAWEKLQPSANTALHEQAATLELYRLTENGQGIIGELSLPGALQVTVILAASRASLRQTLSDIDSVCAETEETASDQVEAGNVENIEEDDRIAQERFKVFEKNSFRSPKFWLQWNGRRTGQGLQGNSETDVCDTGLGYIVFAGNDCRKFKGTISCTSLRWKDAPLNGHKIISRSDTDTEVAWYSAQGRELQL